MRKVAPTFGFLELLGWPNSRGLVNLRFSHAPVPRVAPGSVRGAGDRRAPGGGVAPGGGRGGALRRGVVGHRPVARPAGPGGGGEPVERLFADERRTLGSEATTLARLVGDHEP